MSITRYRLTTIDNPWDPFDDFKTWYFYDVFYLKHDCCGLLARCAHTSEGLSEFENEKEIEKAIDEIIKFDLENIYVKVSKEFEEQTVESNTITAKSA